MDILKSYKRLQALQRRGRHLSTLDDDAGDEVRCMNCGTIFIGNCCPHCAQPASTQRISFSHLVDNFLSIYFNMDSGFVHTIAELLYRPGYMAYDYLKGHRKEYVRPVQLLFFITTVYLFSGYLLGLDFNKDYEVYGKMVELVSQYIHNPFVLKALEYIKSFVTNASLLNLSWAFLMLLPIRLCFRKSPICKSMNFMEILYANVYLTCLQMLLRIISLVFDVSGLVSFLANVCFYHQFFRVSWKVSARRYILAIFLLFLIAIPVIVLFVCLIYFFRIIELPEGSVIIDKFTTN